MATTTAFIQKSPDAPTPAFTGYVAGIATVDLNETATLDIPCGGRSVVRIGVPTITAGTLTFTVVPYRGATARVLKDRSGNTVTVPSSTGDFVVEIPELSGCYSFTIVCGASQGSARLFDVQCVGTEPSPFDVAPAVTQRISKTLTFTGAAGAGLNASPVPVFTTSGGAVQVLSISGRVTTNLAVSNVLAELALGVTGQTGLFIPSTVANTLVTTAANWASTTATAGGITLPAATQNALINANVIGTVGGTGNITGGVLEINCIYAPLTPGASLG